MEYKHYLNNVEIGEPIGFDKFETKVKRGDYHGMSVEVSVSELEFYGNAIDIVKGAYETDIDEEVVYTIYGDGVLMYEGVLDLSTYSEQESEYHSVSCKVGDVGVKTTFNNRAGTDVTIGVAGDSESIDGDTIPVQTWDNCTIPALELTYTNYASYEGVHTVPGKDIHGPNEREDGGGYAPIPDELKACFISLGGLQVVNSEFGSFETGVYYVTDNNGTPLDADPIFIKGDQFVEKYGTESYDYDINIKATITIANTLNNTHSDNAGEKFWIQGLIWRSDSDVDKIIYQGTPIEITNLTTFSVNIIKSGNTDVGGLTVGFWVYNDGGTGTIKHYYSDPAEITSIVFSADTYMRFNVDSHFEKTIKAKMLPVFKALFAVSCKIAGIPVKSKWYQMRDGTVGSSYGGGALKALTNGYRIRQAKDISGADYGLTTNFNNLIKGLNAIDNIGWGFESDANGNISVRVDRWFEFYKNNVVLRINNANNKKRTVATSSIYNSVKVGYKKFTETKDFALCDTIHGERVFVSKLKAVSKEKDCVCEFIADPYAIELTRRQANETVSEGQDWKYDENIFVFEQYATIVTRGVVKGASSAGNLHSPTQMLNPRISPRRNAERWRELLFATNSESDFGISTSKGNDKAYYSADTVGVSHLDTMLGVVHEDATIEHTECRMKAEELSFDYPITISEYNTIVKNPYGLIEVDGEKCWIKEFSYNFIEGLGKFKLIPRNELFYNHQQTINNE